VILLAKEGGVRWWLGDVAGPLQAAQVLGDGDGT
jgi:hypothetical protein